MTLFDVGLLLERILGKVIDPAIKSWKLLGIILLAIITSPITVPIALYGILVTVWDEL